MRAGNNGGGFAARAGRGATRPCRAMRARRKGGRCIGALALVAWLGSTQAPAADFRISSFNQNGLLSWTNAFPSGVCTIEAADAPNGPWQPQLNTFTTSSTGQAAFAKAPQNRFYRLLAVDLSPGNPNGFANLTRAYGRLRTIAGNGGGSLDGVNYWLSNFEGGFATNAALSRPHMATADAAGNVFIADKNSHAVLQVTPDARIHTVAGLHAPGNGPDGPAPGTSVALNSPNGLWLGADGTVYVLDTGNGKVRWLDSNGLLTTLFTSPKGINGGRGLWVKDDRTLAYFDSGSHVKKWTPGGGIQSVNLGDFNDLGNFIVNPAGDLIVTDHGANQVYLLLTSGANPGSSTVLFGNGMTGRAVDGTPALSNVLYGVRGVWPVPTGGHLLATQEGSQVLYIDPAGILHILLDGAAGFHMGDGQWFYLPGFKISEARSVTMDCRGNILIVENDRGYVRQVDFLRLDP